MMKYQIIGDTDCPLIQIALDQGEVVRIERGCMAYMSNVTLEGKMNTSKKGISGMFSAIGRSITSGESIFITEATGAGANAKLGIAPAVPGKIVCLHVTNGQQYRLNTGAFLACDHSVEYVMKRQEIGKAFFGGTGGLFVMETQGDGDVLIACFGDILELDVTPSSPITIDNEHVVAWDASLDYSIRVASGTFGFTSGEGLVNEFKGNGKVYIQTRNIHNLADALRPFFPSSSSN